MTVAALIATKWSPQIASVSRTVGVQRPAALRYQLASPASVANVRPISTARATSGQSHDIVPTARKALMPVKCIAEMPIPMTAPATIDALRLRPRSSIAPASAHSTKATTNDATVGTGRNPDGNGTRYASIAM